MNPDNRPYHFEIPIAYQVKKSFDGFTLYLNVDSYNTIKGLFFMGPADSPWLPIFSELCQLSEGQRLAPDLSDNIYLSTPVKRWNLPLWLLRAASREFFQTLHPHHQLAGHQEDALICRCFGVYLPQILQWGSLKEVTDETRAGGGCTRCRQHIQSFIYKNPSLCPAISPQEFDKIKTVTALFVKHNFPSCSLELVSIHGNRMKIIFSGEQNKRDKILQSVEKLIEQNFQQKILLDDTT